MQGDRFDGKTSGISFDMICLKYKDIQGIDVMQAGLTGHGRNLE